MNPIIRHHAIPNGVVRVVTSLRSKHTAARTRRKDAKTAWFKDPLAAAQNTDRQHVKHFDTNILRTPRDKIMQKIVQQRKNRTAKQNDGNYNLYQLADEYLNIEHDVKAFTPSQETILQKQIGNLLQQRFNYNPISNIQLYDGREEKRVIVKEQISRSSSKGFSEIGDSDHCEDHGTEQSSGPKIQQTEGHPNERIVRSLKDVALPNGTIIDVDISAFEKEEDDMDTFQVLDTAKVNTELLRLWTSDDIIQAVYFNDYLLPTLSSDAETEYYHIRNKAAILDKSYSLPMLVEGTHASDFLEHFVTVAVKQMVPGVTQYTPVIDTKGSVMDMAYIARYDNDYLLVTNGLQKRNVYDYMTTYLVSCRRSGLDVSLRPLVSSAVISIQGPKSAELLQKITLTTGDNSAVGGTYDAYISLPTTFAEFMKCFEGTITYPDNHEDNKLKTERIRGMRISDVGEDGFELVLSSEAATTLVRTLLKQQDVCAVAFKAYDSARMEAGIMRSDIDLPTESSPIQASVAWSVDTKKLRSGSLFGRKHMAAQLINGVAKVDEQKCYVGGRNVPLQPARNQLHQEREQVTASEEPPSVTTGEGDATVGRQDQVPRVKTRKQLWKEIIAKQRSKNAKTLELAIKQLEEARVNAHLEKEVKQEGSHTQSGPLQVERINIAPRADIALEDVIQYYRELHSGTVPSRHRRYRPPIVASALLQTEVAIGFRGHKPDILLNDTGSRKFLNAVALDGETRSFDQKAGTKLIKTPNKTVHKSAHLIGIPVTMTMTQEPTSVPKEHVIDDLKAKGVRFDWEYSPYDFGADANGQLYLKIGTEGMVKVEEVAGHFFNYIKDIVVSKLKKSKVWTPKDGNLTIIAVIAIPCNYTQNQRRAIVFAAESAGMNVAGTVHGITAASTMRAFEQAPGKKRILFCDIGSSGANVGVIEINVPEKDRKKTKANTETQINVLSCVANQGIGGRHHDVALAQHLRNIFETKTKIKLMPQYPNALQKLIKAANKAKIALTIADSTYVNIEGIIKNVDFTKEIVTRQTFNQLIAESIDRLGETVKMALEQAGGIKIEELDGVELIGGSSRVPALQEKLADIVKPHALGFHLNAEEAVAVGAGYLAAAHNPFFKMRSANIGDNSVYMYAIKIVSKDNTHPDAIEKYTPLFKPSGKLHGAKSVVFKTKLDVEVYLKENEQDIAIYHVTGITDNMEKEENRGKLAQITLTFMADDRGIISVVKTNATVIDDATNEEGATEQRKEETTDAATEDKEQEPQNEQEVKDTENKKEEAEEKVQEQTTENQDKKEEKKPVTFDLNVEVMNIYDAFTPENLEKSKAAIDALSRRDMDVAKRSESKNLLESLIYKYKGAAKEQGFQAACDEDTLKKIDGMIKEYEEWFDEESYNATLQQFDERIEKIEYIAKPVHHRWSENESRPALVVSTQKAINKLIKSFEELVEKKPYVVEMTELVERFQNVQKWWEDAQKQQDELQPHEEPVFNANSIKIQIEIAKQALSTLQKTPQPKPPKEENPKEEPEQHNEEKQTEEQQQGEQEKVEEQDSADEPIATDEL
ncbi:Heat shock 70 kDa protein 17 [Babesia sp. Xinjiang]|uniref:Heat shock 70 kDa protein 17 n=1 Tax=Babesia sp. Xinjiang TaxID=462227 RepID=UPI000A2395F6|nr:Heat shock 70 kDa protein 17 [Babesia sp. Xinjiang]ORM42276.1 Heat shock 70 kDa protein 17 [Babesia sp. Xinjiang]